MEEEKNNQKSQNLTDELKKITAGGEFYGAAGQIKAGASAALELPSSSTMIIWINRSGMTSTNQLLVSSSSRGRILNCSCWTWQHVLILCISTQTNMISFRNFGPMWDCGRRRHYHSSTVSLCFHWLVAAQRRPSLTTSTARLQLATWIFCEPPVVSCSCFQTGTTEWQTKDRNGNNKYISNLSDASFIRCSKEWKQLQGLIETNQTRKNVNGGRKETTIICTK